MIDQRKRDHLRICLDLPVEIGQTGFEDYSFVHNPLPEVNLAEIDVSTVFLGKKLRAPLLISSMTGGTSQAALINRNLAKAAQASGIAMGVGSQRIAIEQPNNRTIIKSFQVREWAPDILLFANLGAVQLNYGFGIRECRKAVEMIKADALVLHLNPLQEAIQPKGNTNFKDLFSKIEKIAKSLTVPVIVKEVGGGISKDVGKKLYAAGVRVVETAGWGGTNWAKIEALCQSRSRTKGSRLGEVFSHWGLSTTESILQCREIKGLRIIGSGGVRSGIDVAKAIVLGADLVGLALPFLKPAARSAKAVKMEIDKFIHELRIAMFCLGAENINKLKSTRLIKSSCF